ncbi:MAG: hypothetical protein ABSC65_05910 [Acidobacteriaceae bacterium]|jgi:hypothetical protein
MNGKFWKVFTGLGAVAMSAVWAGQACAQTSEIKEKPALYTYVADWNIPREKWGDMEKSYAGTQKILDKAVADGTIVGYGSDVTLVHQGDGVTHDDWWSAMSLAGVLNVLDQLEKASDSSTSVLASATNHFDNVYESRYYNYHPGTVKDGYTYEASYRLKPDAPDDSVEVLSKKLIVPLLEKLFADGTLREYEVDTQAIHTEAPGLFTIIYLAASAEGLDKVNAALDAAIKADPLGGVAFGSMVDISAHHDELGRSMATYK